jgi:hypothetical protein
MQANLVSNCQRGRFGRLQRVKLNVGISRAQKFAHAHDRAARSYAGDKGIRPERVKK